MDGESGGFFLVDPVSSDELHFDSVYLATLREDCHQFIWGHVSVNLPQSMRSKTHPLRQLGEEKRVLEFMESTLMVESSIVMAQKEVRRPDNEAHCMRIGHDFCSKYHVSELLALAAKALNADAYVSLSFPQHKCTCFYLLFGAPSRREQTTKA